MYIEDGPPLSLVSQLHRYHNGKLSVSCHVHLHRVNNCVGYSNYKFFVLFLFYTVLLSLWFCTTGLFDFIQAWVTLCPPTMCTHTHTYMHTHTHTRKQKGFSTNNSTKFNVIFCYFVSSLFGLSTSVLLAFHIYLSFFNRTTLGRLIQ